MLFFFFLLGRPPGSALFPYTTLFRSRRSPELIARYFVAACRQLARSGERYPLARARSLGDAEVEAFAERWSVSPEARSEEQRLNSSHVEISYAVFCLKKKKYYRAMHM